MPFEPTVDSLESVAEDARVFYREGSDKKFHLVTAENVTKLESSLTAVRGELTTTKERAKQIDAWEKLGKKPDEIQALLDQHAKDEENKLTQAGEWDKLKAQIEENHGKVVGEKDGRIKTLSGALENHLIGEKAATAIADAKGNATLLMPHVRARLKMEEKDGEFSVTVLMPDGKTPALNSKNEPMSITELVASMRDDKTFGAAFESAAHSGGGGGGGGGGDGAGGTWQGKKKSEMTVKEKAAAIEELGPTAYGKLAQ